MEESQPVRKLCWLILSDNSTGQWGSQVKDYSECVSKSVLEEINIWIYRMSKADCPPQYGREPSNLLKAWIEQQAG